MIFIDSIIVAAQCFVKSQMASCCDPKRSYTGGGPAGGIRIECTETAGQVDLLTAGVIERGNWGQKVGS